LLLYIFLFNTRMKIEDFERNLLKSKMEKV